MAKTKTVLEHSISPVYRTIKTTSKIIYNFRAPIFGISVFYMGVLGHNLWAPIPEISAAAQIMLPAIKSWAPTHEVLVVSLACFQNLMCTPVYCASNTIFSMYAAVREGMLDALLPPDFGKNLRALIKSAIEDFKKDK